MSAEVTPAAIVVAHHDASRLEMLRTLLERRFGDDYAIVTERSGEAALETLVRLRDTGTDVAVVLAEQLLAGCTGTELLAQVPSVFRDARRALLVSWAERTTADWIVKASAVGQFDAIVIEPWRDVDEAFFLAIGELLAEWEQLHRPPFAAVSVVGDPWDPYTYGLQDALHRSSVPYRFYEADSDDGRALLERAGEEVELPAAVLHDGQVLGRPTPAALAGALGVNADPGVGLFDVAIVGSGPGGLAAAVYAASEGLRVVMLERIAVGGQASSSSLIRNYLGFPRGLSGSELTSRAYLQAWVLGASSIIGREAVGLAVQPDNLVLTLDDGSELRSRSVILATGVDYRRIGIENLDRLVGQGVFYGAGVTEAPAMANEHVFIAGGANSAGQAALFLSRFAADVTILIRGSVLTEMSEYLVREIDARPNVSVRGNTVVEDGRADFRLRGLVLRDTATGTTEEVPATALFILIGAAPRTEWLPPKIERDAEGYILTGDDLGAGRRGQLETSVPGVFAVGDVRAGSMKRVAAAVGEGSTAVRLVHDHLATLGR